MWWWLRSPGVVHRIASLLLLLGQEDSMHVWQNTTRCDGDLAKQLVHSNASHLSKQCDQKTRPTRPNDVFWENRKISLDNPRFKVVVIKITRCCVVVAEFTLPSSRSSWAEGQHECLAKHRQMRWWPCQAACSAPHHSSLPAECAWVPSWSSCCLWQHCLPAPESQQIGTPTLQPDRLVLLLQFWWRTCPSSGSEQHAPLGTAKKHLSQPNAGTALHIHRMQSIFGRGINDLSSMYNGSCLQLLNAHF